MSAAECGWSNSTKTENRSATNMANQIPKMTGLTAVTSGQQLSPAFHWSGGAGYLVAAGTFAAGTASVEYSPDEITWVKTDAELTADGMDRFETPPGKLRAVLDSLLTTVVDVWVGSVPPHGLP
jgi:hypothetical protein